MQNFIGSCLCRAVTHKSSTTALRIFNCHSEDCKKCGGAPYLTNVFFKEASLDIQENLKSHIYQWESGNKITKKLSRQSGCQMFSVNDGRPRLVGVRAGTVNELEVVKSQGDVWVSNNELSIKLDKTLDQFQRNFT